MNCWSTTSQASTSGARHTPSKTLCALVVQLRTATASDFPDPKSLPLPYTSASSRTHFAGAAESASAQTRQGPDVASSEELIGTTSSEETIIVSPQTTPHNTIDVSSSTFPSRREDLVVAGVVQCVSALTLQDSDDVSSSDDFSDSSSEEPITGSPRIVSRNTTDDSPQSSSSSLGSKILIQHYANCYQVFYIRMDRSGSFLTYPGVGGPFRSVREAVHATKSFVDELWREARCKERDEFSRDERGIHDRQYYLDGPTKKAPGSSTPNHAHELEDILENQMIYENNWWYCHFNFTTKQKGASNDPSTRGKLFFAEVSHEQGESACEVNCCCWIGREPNGAFCYGCKNNGSPSMKHPSDSSAFAGGHLDGWYLPYGCLELSSSDDENDARKNMEDDDDEDDDEEDDDDEETRWPAFNPLWTPMFSPEVDRDLYELLMED
ncbi:hypothetical protein EJB05_46373, partial [Eragrostis curvula]